MKNSSKNIKLLILDCDGVLTDGKLYYSGGLVETKSFSVVDGLGVKLLEHTDIICSVISGRESEALTRRCSELQIKEVFQGVKNKVITAEKLINKLSINWENVAFMGDDWNDYSLIKKVGLSAVPNQACRELKEVADFVAERNGGDGAVREFIEYIIKGQGLFDTVIKSFVNKLEK